MTRTIRINAAAPDKPPVGAACNGCGVCCLSQPCPLGMLASLRTHGPCGALRWDDTALRYRCGLVASAVGPLVERWIAAGSGCDSDATLA